EAVPARQRQARGHGQGHEQDERQERECRKDVEDRENGAPTRPCGGAPNLVRSCCGRQCQPYGWNWAYWPWMSVAYCCGVIWPPITLNGPPGVPGTRIICAPSPRACTMGAEKYVPCRKYSALPALNSSIAACAVLPRKPVPK